MYPRWPVNTAIDAPRPIEKKTETLKPISTFNGDICQVVSEV